MPYWISLKYRTGDVERGSMSLGDNETWAREILEQRMSTCRQNDWPMVTMGLLWSDEQPARMVDTLHRDGRWQSELVDKSEGA